MMPVLRRSAYSEVEEQLRTYIAELEETIDAIRRGGVDAVLVGPPGVEQIYTRTSAERPYKTIVDNMSEGALTVSARGIILFANRRFTEMMGTGRSPVVGDSLAALVHNDKFGLLDGLLAVGPGGLSRADLELITSNGPLMVSVSATGLDLDGVFVRCLIATDLTSQLEARVHLETEVASRTADLQQVNVTMAETNRTLRVVSSGEQALIRATNEASLMASICRTIVEDGDFGLAWVGQAVDDDAQGVRPVGAAGDTAYLDEIEVSWGNGRLGGSTTGCAIQTRTTQVTKDVQSRRRSRPWAVAAAAHGFTSVCSFPIHAGATFSGALTIYSHTPDAFDAASVDLLQGLAEDLSYGIGRLRDADRLVYQAFHDPLTGLHNRPWILDILKADLLEAKRRDTSVASLFLDLDNFKNVNDSLGHAAGDEVLTAVANRIRGSLRPEDRLGRLGGDEFVIVMQDVVDTLDVERFAERVSAAISTELQVAGHRIVPTASIGIAVSTSTSTPEVLLGNADSAMFRAKAAGRGGWHFFDEAMHAQALARLTVEDQLRDAITRGEFVVYYQPIVALADFHVVGHEALVRWQHPTRGLLSPGEFLDVAEDSGLINAIGAQVLDQVCALLAQRPDLSGPISVNVSAIQLAAPNWLDAVTSTITAHRVDPARLVVEVTETAALGLTDSALSALETLNALGVGIHLDDFGTGYSSISVLRDLPVTGVKLDLRFVQDLTTGDSQANALTHGLSGLVNGMRLTGIAEGVETQMQADILRAQGWGCGQGYYFGRPAAACQQPNQR